jgi:hypothetical protein
MEYDDCQVFYCDQCGTEFTFDVEFMFGDGDFCSNECADEYFKENPPFGNGQG